MFFDFFFYLCSKRKTKHIMKKELLTEKQRARKQADALVAAEYLKMRKAYPKASRTLILQEMANHACVGLTSVSGIRTSLLRTGIIVSKA